MINSKPWYTSKTLWIQGLTITAAVLTYVSGVDLPPTAVIVIGSVLAGVNTAVRLITTQPVGS